MDDVASLETGIGHDEVGGAAEDDYAGGNAQRSDLIAQFVGEVDGKDAELGDEIFLGIGGVEELIHLVAMFDGGNEKSFFLVAAQDLELEHLIEAVKIEGGRERGKSFDAVIVGGENDVLNLQAGGGGGAVGLDVGDDDSPVLRELEAIGQRGGDFLGDGADLDAMNVAVLAQAVVDEIDDAGGDGESEAFAAAALRKDESIDADDGAVHIDQRAAAVAGVDGSVGLNVGEGLFGIGLAGDGADHAHGDGVLQAFGTADGEDQLTDARTLREQGKRGKIFFVDLEEGEIRFFVGTDEAGLEDAAFPDGHGAAGIAGQGQSDADALRAFDDVGVGHDVTIGIDDDAGADGMLAHDESGLGCGSPRAAGRSR